MKGYFWIATQPDLMFSLSICGGKQSVECELAGEWRVSSPDLPENDPEFDQMKEEWWDDTFGDRHQEIVFIGRDFICPKSINQQLESCLISEWSPESISSWLDLPNPFLEQDDSDSSDTSPDTY